MTQLTLDDLTPRVEGCDTSEAAAESMRPTASTLRARVLRIIRERGSLGATCDEVEWVSGLRHQTASARVYELRKRSRIVDSGRRRKTRSGRNAIVWVAT